MSTLLTFVVSLGDGLPSLIKSGYPGVDVFTLFVVEPNRFLLSGVTEPMSSFTITPVFPLSTQEMGVGICVGVLEVGVRT